MCIRDRFAGVAVPDLAAAVRPFLAPVVIGTLTVTLLRLDSVSYTHLRAHETVLDLVCRLLLEKKKHTV